MITSKSGKVKIRVRFGDFSSELSSGTVVSSSETLDLLDGAFSFFFMEEDFFSLLSHSFWNKSRISSAPEISGTSETETGLSSSFMANLEKRVSSSSGSSTFVMINTILSGVMGIASIIRGILSASNPNSSCACSIISRKRFFAFSVP